MSERRDFFFAKAHRYGMIQNEREVRMFLDWFAQRSVRRLMEIGTHTGGFLYLMMAHMNAEHSRVISVDLPWQEHEYAVGNFRGDHPSLYFLVGNSHDVATVAQVKEGLEGEKLDFLFLDGDHSESGCREDFNTYKQFVRPGGWIGFHDINNGHGCGKFYWNEAINDRAHVEFGFGRTFGIGCIEV